MPSQTQNLSDLLTLSMKIALTNGMALPGPPKTPKDLPPEIFSGAPEGRPKKFLKRESDTPKMNRGEAFGSYITCNLGA